MGALFLNTYMVYPIKALEIIYKSQCSLHRIPFHKKSHNAI